MLSSSLLVSFNVQFSNVLLKVCILKISCMLTNFNSHNIKNYKNYKCFTAPPWSRQFTRYIPLFFVLIFLFLPFVFIALYFKLVCLSRFKSNRDRIVHLFKVPDFLQHLQAKSPIHHNKVAFVSVASLLLQQIWFKTQPTWKVSI